MKMARMYSLPFILSLIFVLLCAVAVNGQCPGDSDTSHTDAERNGQRLFTYTSKAPARASTSGTLSFMTFNQRSGFHTDCRNDVTAQANLIRQHADYIGTQETVQNVDTRCNRCNIPQIIADVAGMATRFVMALPWRTGQYGISAGTSQIILETKYITMAHSGYETRAAVALRTQPLVLQGRNLWFLDIHVEYYSLAVRQAQITQILNFVQNDILKSDPQAVIVIAGDFNGGPWDPVYATMKLSGFKNSWEVFNKGSILEGNTIPADWPGARFDHIWYRAPTGVAINVAEAVVPDVRLSDHRPFVARLSFTLSGGAAPTSRPPVAATTRPETSATVAPTIAPPATTESVVCVGPIWEQVSVTITCPLASQKISAVQFASYGNPTGTCRNFKLGSCIGGSSTAVVVDKCVNRNTCTFPVANNVFGDPCPGSGKHFMAQVLCK